MSSPAYKGGSQQVGLWMLFSFGTVVAFLTVVMLSIHWRLEDVAGAWTLVPAAATLIGGIALGWIVTARRNRERIQRVTTRLEGDGFQTNAKPAEDERTQFAAPLVHLFPWLDLRHGATGIQWFAVERAGGMRLFEHRYTTGSGRTLNEHFHTVIAWPAAHRELGQTGLATAPWLFMAQYHRFLRRDVRKRELTSPEFADVAVRWSLIGDAATAARFLQPAVRTQLQNSPKQETWCMGAGFVCCLYKGVFDVAQLEKFLAHARATLAAAS
jgi:hypothetical protein